ncbi:MAG TPA: hypothetical protein VMV18_07280 [bacterium]|nr:hypothetical protein [bacterium]
MTAWLLAAAITVEAGWGTCRPSDAPLPVRVEAVGGEGDYHGRLLITDARQNVVELPIDLPRGAHKRWRVPMPAGAGIARADWDGAAGDAVLVQTIPHPVCGGALVGVLDRAAGTSVRFPAANESGSVRSFAVGAVVPEDFDAPWQTLDTLDAIVAEARALSDLSETRFLALRTWVLAGGLLVVTPGADPAPLLASGRLPGTVALTGPVLSESPWGQGAVLSIPVAAPDPTSNDAAALRARIWLQTAERAEARTQRALLRRALASSVGPGTARGGVPLVALAIFAATLGAAHELMRRRWVTRVKHLSEYATILGGSVVALGVVSFVIARSTLAESSGNSVRIFQEGAAIARRVDAVPLLPGESVEIPVDAVLEAEDSVRVHLGTPSTAEVMGPLVRIGAAWSAWDAGGAIRIVRVPGGFEITNGTHENLGEGTLFDRPSAYAVPPIRAGGSATLTRPLPLVPEIPVAAPFAGDATHYVSRVDRGWVVVRAGTK